MSDPFAGPVAARYDESTAGMPVEPVVDFLLPLAGGGALELAIGTGRIALPLAERGVRVAGIDLSPDMVAELRKKPGGDPIPVAIGDMTTTRVEGPFSLAYVVYNSIFNLRTQERQVACFENVSSQLEPGGAFVVEIMVPELQRLPLGDRFLLFDASPDHVGFDEYDLVTQGLTSHHYDPERGTYSTFPGRYIWPSELDLMARLAGLELRERWADWDRTPFTAESTKHVSVWEKPSG
ncbi:MAG TPA: class I SAM-dependent methyltransferase [Gaiellaceae bacterium]|nr:class I SAM-dependent methyltransferase [Gaiellaceae bacterium]